MAVHRLARSTSFNVFKKISTPVKALRIRAQAATAPGQGQDGKRPRIAIVGAGLAGLACANVVAPHAEVTLVDAGRTPGGRAGSVEPWDGQYSFDHGCQYFKPSADHTHFGSLIRELATAGGAAAEWSTVGSASTDKNGVLSLSSFEPYPYKVYVGTPNMAAVAEHLLNRVVEHLEVRPDIMRSSMCLSAASKAAENNPAPQRLVLDNTTATGVRPRASAEGAPWELELRVRDGGHYWYKLLDADLVVTALGHKQTATLLLPVAPDYVAPAVSVQSNVTWALMVAFENSLGLSLNGVLLKGEPLKSDISWIACNSSKPGRPEGAECWVVHMSPEWSDERAAAKAVDVVPEMLAAFLHCINKKGMEIVYSKGFKWTNAFPLNPVCKPYIWDENLGLGMCGDWVAGMRAGDAYDSGINLGHRILQHIDVEPPQQAE